MGYDMYFRDACRSGARSDETYFRLNIFGMGRYREYMYERGMIFDAGDVPPWPEGDWELADRVKWEVREPGFYADMPPLTDEQRKAGRAMLEEADQILAWHGPEIPGIPAHKFGSNDGWLVTPAECEAAYRIGKEQPVPEGDRDEQDYWAQWLDYLHRAASHGGIEVH